MNATNGSEGCVCVCVCVCVCERRYYFVELMLSVCYHITPKCIRSRNVQYAHHLSGNTLAVF